MSTLGTIPINFYQKRLVTENPVFSIKVSHPHPPLLLEPPGHILFDSTIM